SYPRRTSYRHFMHTGSVVSTANFAKRAAFGALVFLLADSSSQAQDAVDRIRPKYLEETRQAIERYAAERNEVPRSGPYREVRANLHVHSELSHDSRGKIDDIVAAAKKAGSEVLLFTEHPSKEKDFFLDGHNGLRDGVLLIPGAEMKGMLVYPTMSLRPFESADSQEITQLVRSRGGHVFLSHLEERMDWEIAGLSGVEIYNTHADFKKQKKLVESMKNPLWIIKTTELIKKYPQEVFSALQTYPEDYLERWDQLCQKFPHAGVAANDAHQHVGIRIKIASDTEVSIEDPNEDPLLKVNRLLVAPLLSIPKDAKPGDLVFSMQLDPYEISLRHAGTHLLVEDLTKEGVMDALEQGRTFVGFDWLADSKGVQVAMLDAKENAAQPKQHQIGSHIPFHDELRLVGKSPLSAHWKIVRNGKVFVELDGDAVDVKIESDGIYRVEIWLQANNEPRIWVMTSPFYVQP
ncbi:MAG: PHP domain-containing protein, partial [Pirellula sp.]